MSKRRTSDVDVTIGCYQGDNSSWDNVELWILMQPLGVIMVITVHVTTPFLHSFLFGTKLFAHTCNISRPTILNNLNAGGILNYYLIPVARL